MQTHCTALAKVVVNKRLNTLRLLVTFDTAAGRVTVQNAAFKSGDLCDVDADAEVVAKEVGRAVALAKQVLRTDNFVFVE